MPAPSLPAPGATLSRYRLQEQLGSGAMGVVFRAHDTLLDATVCVKVLNPGAGHSKETILRFRREAALARRITHPGVCRLFDLHEENGLHFLTMEFIDGKMLRDAIVDDGSLDVTSTLRILEGLAAALDAAHGVGVVHRDLKPRNIMIRRDGSPCILDFGIATATDVDGLTRPGVAMGTMHYIAPEVWMGMPATVQSDLYSLGIIGYNCLTGRMPFKLVDGGLIEDMKRGRPAPPSSFRGGVPPELDALVLSLLALEPSDRPREAKVVQRALRELLRARGAAPSSGLDLDTLSTSDASIPHLSGTALDGGTSGALSGTQIANAGPLLAQAGHLTDDHTTTLIGLGNASDDETVPPTNRPAVSVAHTARPFDLVSHSIVIDGVPQSHHVEPARVAREIAVPSVKAAQETTRTRAPLAALFVVALVVGAAVFLFAKGEVAPGAVDDETEARAAKDPVLSGRAPAASLDAPPSIGDAPPREDTPPHAPEEVAVAVVGAPSTDVTTPGPMANDTPRPMEVTASQDDDGARASRRGGKATRTGSKRVDPDRARFDELHAQLDKAERQRGLLRRDLPKLDAQVAELKRAERKGDLESAERAFAEAMRVVENARIDNAFIDLKLARFNVAFDKAANPDAKAKATPVMTDVLKFKSAARFDDANKRLNDGFRILRD